MKRIITIMLLMLTAVGIQAQKQISYIKADGAWYQVYDENGKKMAHRGLSPCDDSHG